MDRGSQGISDPISRRRSFYESVEDENVLLLGYINQPSDSDKKDWEHWKRIARGR